MQCSHEKKLCSIPTRLVRFRNVIRTTGNLKSETPGGKMRLYIGDDQEVA